MNKELELKEKCHYTTGRYCGNCEYFGHYASTGCRSEYACKHPKNRCRPENHWAPGIYISSDGCCDYWQPEKHLEDFLGKTITFEYFDGTTWCEQGGKIDLVIPRHIVPEVDGVYITPKNLIYRRKSKYDRICLINESNSHPLIVPLGSDKIRNLKLKEL